MLLLYYQIQIEKKNYDILHDETFLFEDQIFEWHTTCYASISFTVFWHREYMNCTLWCSIYRCVTSLILKTFLIIFEIYTSTITLQYLLSQYVTWICCWEFQGNFFMSQPYSLKHMIIGRAPLYYWFRSEHSQHSQ